MAGMQVAVVAEAERDRAIGTLVSAFETDPVERWLIPPTRSIATTFPVFIAAFGGAAFNARRTRSGYDRGRARSHHHSRGPQAPTAVVVPGSIEACGPGTKPVAANGQHQAGDAAHHPVTKRQFSVAKRQFSVAFTHAREQAKLIRDGVRGQVRSAHHDEAPNQAHDSTLETADEPMPRTCVAEDM